jgi:REP element-mobilizing transposase RayT
MAIEGCLLQIGCVVARSHRLEAEVDAEGVSSRRLQLKFPAVKAFWSVRKSRGVLWTPSSFAGPVGGAPLSILKQYIEQQEGAATSSP